MKNIEIEIRIKLSNPDSFLKWMKKSAKLLEISDQADYYFEPPGKSFIYIDHDGYKDADEWFRVRMAGKNEICYKKWHRDKKTHKSLYADEIETPIEDGDKVLDIIKRIGFKQISVIKKHRESWLYNNFRFDCDQVEQLGFFVEIEFKGEIDDPAKGRDKIFDLLREIGIKDWRVIKRGYPWMQWNPDKNHFE